MTPSAQCGCYERSKVGSLSQATNSINVWIMSEMVSFESLTAVLCTVRTATNPVPKSPGSVASPIQVSDDGPHESTTVQMSVFEFSCVSSLTCSVLCFTFLIYLSTLRLSDYPTITLPLDSGDKPHDIGHVRAPMESRTIFTLFEVHAISVCTEGLLSSCPMVWECPTLPLVCSLVTVETALTANTCQPPVRPQFEHVLSTSASAIRRYCLTYCVSPYNVRTL